VREHTDLIAAIRAGARLNEGESVATSTLMAIMGRLAAYTGQEATWDFVLNQSKLDYVHLAADARPGPCPMDPWPIPGKTRLV